MSQDKADKFGAIGLFKEKYKDKVSIYKIGNYSIEYCGGPHVNSTAALQGFKIIKEESIGSGRRRIYAELA
jgi:alanyl-tRNA synthetase